MFLHCSFNRWFGMIQSHPNTPQTPFRPLSYISRHPKIYLCWRCEVHCQEFLTAQPQLGKAVIAYDLISNCYSINTVLATSMINQTPSRNPPDTIRHNAITSVFSLSVASTRHLVLNLTCSDVFYGLQFMSYACPMHQGDWIVSGGFLDSVRLVLDIAKTVLME